MVTHPDEKTGSNQWANWRYFGTDGTVIVLTPEGTEKVLKEFNTLLAASSPEKRAEKNMWVAPEVVIHHENLYLLILFELVMYGRFSYKNFIERFSGAYGRMSIDFDEVTEQICRFLEVTFSY